MYKRGKSWISDFWFDGVRYKRSWGRVSKTLAAQKERDYRGRIERGELLIRKSPKLMTFDDFAEEYLEYAQANKRDSSARRNVTSINMLKKHFKGMPLRSIHPVSIEQYKLKRQAGEIEGKKKRGSVSPATINRDLDTLRNMLGKAVKWGYLISNPGAGVSRLSERTEKDWILSPEDEKKLLQAAETRPQKKKYLKDLVLFALYSGMRQGEIFALKKFQINLKNRYILVADSKTHEGRKVPINDTLAVVIRRRLKDKSSEYLFCNHQGKRLTVLTNAFWEAVRKSGLTRLDSRDGKTEEVRFRFHDLRHTFGSRLGMAGADLKTIMEIMGHRTERVALRYQHPTPSHKLAAVRALDHKPEASDNVVAVDFAPPEASG
jgi:integrase